MTNIYVDESIRCPNCKDRRAARVTFACVDCHDKAEGELAALRAVAEAARERRRDMIGLTHDGDIDRRWEALWNAIVELDKALK